MPGKAGKAAAKASKDGYIRRLEKRVKDTENKTRKRDRAYAVFNRVMDFLIALVKR